MAIQNAPPSNGMGFGFAYRCSTPKAMYLSFFSYDDASIDSTWDLYLFVVSYSSCIHYPGRNLSYDVTSVKYQFLLLLLLVCHVIMYFQALQADWISFSAFDHFHIHGLVTVGQWSAYCPFRFFSRIRCFPVSKGSRRWQDLDCRQPARTTRKHMCPVPVTRMRKTPNRSCLSSSPRWSRQAPWHMQPLLHS